MIKHRSSFNETMRVRWRKGAFHARLRTRSGLTQLAVTLDAPARSPVSQAALITLPPQAGEFVKKSGDTFKVKSKSINVYSSVFALPNHAFGIMAPAKKQSCCFSLMRTQQADYIRHQNPHFPPEVGRMSFLAAPPPPIFSGMCED